MRKSNRKLMLAFVLIASLLVALTGEITRLGAIHRVSTQPHHAALAWICSAPFMVYM